MTETQQSDSLMRTTIDADERLKNVSRVLLTIRDLKRVGGYAVNSCARTADTVDSDDELLY